MSRIAIIDTSTANIASVRFALERLGLSPALARDPDEAAEAERLILPGVGAAGPAMRTLTERGWTEVLRRRERPVLGLCLGMQLLFERSDEDGAALLGLIPAQIERLHPGEAGPWPHMGWNALEDLAEDEVLVAGLEPGERVYFVHGYYATAGPWTRASAQYGPAITAIARDGEAVGCQFHPERSGVVGARILANFTGASV